MGRKFSKKMAVSIVHRGPDDSGEWVDGTAGIALAHRRFSILDLSSAGHQPMISVSGRYVIVFNGEIYNHMALRVDLGNQPWRGYSDTETLLAAIERWGMESTLIKTVGMFALALWDRQERMLSIAKDRIGEKPLYYGWQDNNFLFGSDVGNINRDVLMLFLCHGYIPAPHSIYSGIYKLLPGTFLRLSEEAHKGTLPEPVAYWSLLDVVTSGHVNPYQGNEHEAILELESRLSESIRLQMVADVSLGAFLSGGIDSSIVVALMQAQSSRPVKTFTIGFEEKDYNEATHAKAVALHLGTDHTELYVTPNEAMEVIPELPVMYDEPFGDSSAIPTFLVSQIARQHVTVSLSGDGGDELFGGYKRYVNAERIWRKIQLIPFALRKMMAGIIRMWSTKNLDLFFSPVVALSGYRKVRSPGVMAHLLANVLVCKSLNEFYRVMLSQWSNSVEIINNITQLLAIITERSHNLNIKHPIERMMYEDMQTYLPYDILVKVDRAAMANSLETRIPFLDQRVVEFAWQLPFSTKVRYRQGKWILNQILHKYIPKELIDRPKMGFGVPLDIWMRGPLREWAEDLLSERRMTQEGFFDPEPIRKRWLQHLAGQHNWRDSLWTILSFQAWLSENSTT